MIKIPPGQKEKGQRDRRIKIGLIAAHYGFKQRNPASKDQCQTDRHIHAQPPHPQSRPCATKKRLARKSHRWQGNDGGNPMEHIARGFGRARPDCHGKQHHIHHRKPGNAQPDQQILALTVRFGCRQKARIQLVRLIPQPRQCRDKLRSGDVRCCLNTNPAQCQVHPGRDHAGHCGKAALDRGHAGGAMR